IIRAVETPIMAAQGPRRIAKSVPPTACAVVPSGIGTLNIIIVKEKAAPIESNGMFLAFSVPDAFLADAIAKAPLTIPRITSVCGLRYPSGICINNSSFFIIKKTMESMTRQLSGQDLHGLVFHNE